MKIIFFIAFSMSVCISFLLKLHLQKQERKIKQSSLILK